MGEPDSVIFYLTPATATTPPPKRLQGEAMAGGGSVIVPLLQQEGMITASICLRLVSH